MFIGRLADLPVQRACLPAAIVRALDALNALDLATLPNGRHELEGDRLFVLIQDATPRAIEDSRIEAHATYADIQLPLGARECFGFSLAQPGLAACDDQLAERDLAFARTRKTKPSSTSHQAITSFFCRELSFGGRRIRFLAIRH